MKALVTTAIQWHPLSSSKFASPRPRFSLWLECHGNADISQSSNGEEKHAEIWHYFKEAQQKTSGTQSSNGDCQIKGSNSQPSWFTAKRLLLIFCVINMLNYVDRGVIASNGVNGILETYNDFGVCTSASGIQGDFNLNNFQDGILSSAFMVGLLVASPIFASLSMRLIGVGLSIWTFATAGCGASFDFWSIMFCRMLVGVGEASFMSLAAPFIDDNAPAAQKTAWLAMFYMCIPTGIALGYVYGGFVGSFFNWRIAFWSEAFRMLPFAVLGFIVKPLPLKGFAHTDSDKGLTTIEATHSVVEETDDQEWLESDENTKPSPTSKLGDQVFKFLKDMEVLLLDKVYLVNVLGYISYNFAIGAHSYWGPKAGYNIYHMNNADLLFGGVTIICGILGTISGGLILDNMNTTISNAFKLLSGAMFLRAIFCFTAFCMRSLYVFLALFALGDLLVFATEDHVQNWRETTLILTSILFLASGIWLAGIFLDSFDMSEADGENQASTVNRANIKPLLVENREDGADDLRET